MDARAIGVFLVLLWGKEKERGLRLFVFLEHAGYCLVRFDDDLALGHGEAAGLLRILVFGCGRDSAWLLKMMRNINRPG